MFGLLGLMLVGAIVGVIAKLLARGRAPGGFIVAILVGIAGALLGRFVGLVFGGYREGDGATLVMSFLGGTLLLLVVALYSAFIKDKT
jgi:uncharacterized membrane protein YeaQ/YmgE (transglycosylase-associated protein family)